MVLVDHHSRSKWLTVLVKKSWRGLSLTTLPWYDKMSRETYTAATLELLSTKPSHFKQMTDNGPMTWVWSEKNSNLIWDGQRTCHDRGEFISIIGLVINFSSSYGVFNALHVEFWNWESFQFHTAKINLLTPTWPMCNAQAHASAVFKWRNSFWLFRFFSISAAGVWHTEREFLIEACSQLWLPEKPIGSSHRPDAQEQLFDN